MITVLYLGHLSDLFGQSTEQLAWTGGTTEDLLTLLKSRGEPWLSALQPNKIFRIAVNKMIQHDTADILDGAEIGILPPVTGG